MKAVIPISIFLTLVHQCVSVGNDRVFVGSLSEGEEFCYGHKNCGPATWKGTEGSCQVGKSQSPINISPKSTKPAFVKVSRLEAPHFNMWNSGHGIAVEFNSKGYTFDGFGQLPRNYTFNNGHFHWGTSSDMGSEHLIKGRSYSMELHLVHFDSNKPNTYDAARNSNDPLAVAVFAILFQVDPDAPPCEALAPIVNQLKKGTTELKTLSKEPVFVNEVIDWTSIIPTIHSHAERVLNYQGSFTTPPCNEIVDWYVYERINRISESDVAEFRKVIGSSQFDKPLLKNYRPVQPLNDRIVVELKLKLA